MRYLATNILTQVFGVAALLLLPFALALAKVSICAAAETPVKLSIRVRETRLRLEPRFWGRGIQSLKYGDVVTQLGESPGWFEVRTAAGKEGFLSAAALSEAPVLKSTSSAIAVSTVENGAVALAGKGFSKEFEQQYAKLNPQFDFRAVGEVEKVMVSDADLLAFARSGGLRERGSAGERGK